MCVEEMMWVPPSQSISALISLYLLCYIDRYNPHHLSPTLVDTANLPVVVLNQLTNLLMRQVLRAFIHLGWPRTKTHARN